MGACTENRDLITMNRILLEKIQKINENNNNERHEQKINELINENKKLKQDLKELNDNYKNINNINNNLEEDKKQLNSKYKKLRKEIVLLKDDKSDLLSKNKALIQANKNNDIESKKLENKYYNAIKEMDEIKRVNQENENYRKFLESEKDKFINNFSKIANKVIYENIEIKINNILKNLEDDLTKEIFDLINSYNFVNKIKEEKDNAIIDAVSEFNQKSKHLNIILLGKTGIGKSELINALKGEDVAETGGFRPVTKETKYYEANSLRIFDNQGYEISKDSNLDIILERIKLLINKSKNDEDPDKFIHCIWYCITGSRFEEDEEKAIGKLLDCYEDKSLPIIIVYLKATCKQWVNDMRNGINNTFNKNMPFIPVLSKDVEDYNGNITKKFGLKDLVKLTGTKVMNAINSISFEYVLNNVKRKMRKKIEKINVNTSLKNRIEISIISYLEKIIGKLDIITINSIKKTISNLNVICNNINFNEEIDNIMNDFKLCIKKKKIKYDDSTKYDYYTNIQNIVKNNILKIFENYYNDYIQNNLIEKIFYFYITLIKNVIEKIVINNMRAIKKDVISQMKEAIKNNPNFEKIFVH